MTKNQPKIYVGSDDYYEIVTKSDVFVDKSLLIKDLDNTGKAVLVTRPRRWGKSCALDMIEKFFAMQIDRDGNVSLYNSNRALFEGGNITLPIVGERHLSRLKIADADEGFYMRYQGKYPVIHITLKGVIGDSVLMIETMLGDVIRKAFIQHVYLRHSNALSLEQQQDFSSYIDNQLSQTRVILSLKTLTTYLALHHGAKVFVLIDEYDKPINYLMESGLSEKNEAMIRSVAQTLTAMFAECGKSNVYLEKMILTGIFDTLQKAGNSGLNNLSVFDLNSPVLGEYFGFTEQEVIELSEKMLKDDQERGLKVINDWYNGYFLPKSNDATLRIFTPWAVVNYLNKASYRGDFIGEGYWTKSGTSTIFRNLLQSGAIEQDLIDKLKLLMKGEEVALSFDNQLSFLEQDINNKFYTESLASYLLFSTGYLTGRKSDGQYYFTIPNNEVRDEFARSLKHEISLIQSREHHHLLLHKKFLLEMASKIGNSGDVTKLFKALLENEVQTAKLIIRQSSLCQNEHFSYFHITAIVGNPEIFSHILTHCGKNLIDEKDALQGFTPLDYAILFNHKAVIDLLEKNGAQSSKLSLPSYFTQVYCEDFLLLSTSLVLGSVKFILKNAPQQLSQLLLAIVGSYVAMNAKSLKSAFDDDVCEEYQNYKDIKQDSLLWFKKYMLSHSKAYTTLDENCDKEKTFPVSSLTMPFFADDAQSNDFTITLCDGQSDSLVDRVYMQHILTNVLAITVPLAVGAYVMPWHDIVRVAGEMIGELPEIIE